MLIDIEERVTAIIRDVAEEAIMPRFQRLIQGDIEEKSPGELVTIADKHAEALISRRLLGILPQSTVVGEEATASNPSLLQTIETGYVWLVDPLDGTTNFVAGRAEFAILVALLLNGTIVASWQFLPLTRTMYTAGKGAGAFIDGVRIRTKADLLPVGQRRGAILTRFLSDQFKARVTALVPAVVAEILPGTKCAGIDYPRVATGVQDFVMFWRLLPWDHAAGVLFLEEAGGFVRHLDGEEYRAGRQRECLLAACNQETWNLIHRGVTDTPAAHRTS